MTERVQASDELRRARLGVFVAFFVCGAAFATWAARVPDAQHRLGLTAGQLAIGLVGLAAGSVLALVASGPLLTRVGSRAGVVVGSGTMCAGLALAAYAPTAAVFVATLAILGAGNSLLDVSMNAHAARVEDGYGRPIFAAFHAFWNVGGLAGSGVAAVLAALQVPIGIHFPLVAGLLFVLACWAARSRLLDSPDPGVGGAAFALPSRGLLALGAIAFCGFIAEGTVNDWSAVYLRDVTQASLPVASLGYFAFSSTMIAIRLVADRLTSIGGAVRIVRVATIVAVAGYAVLVAVPIPGAGVAAFAVIGVGVAAIVPLAWSSAARKSPQNSGRAIAAVATCGYLGFLLGPVLVGGLASITDLHLAVGVAGLFTAAILPLTPALRAPKYGQTQPSSTTR